MIETEIISSVRYFIQFSYAPTFGEMYMFLPEKRDAGKVRTMLGKMVKKGQIIVLDCGDKEKRYTLGGYRSLNNEIKKNITVSVTKKMRLSPYLNVVSKLPDVRLIGLSGSVAMNNAGAGDDIDLFIITRAGRMYTARFWLVLCAYLSGQKRPKNASKSQSADKVCLNMFFDERGLKIAEKKQNNYVAHEVLQMKPLINKNGTYERFLDANKWVYGLYPNARHVGAAPRKGAAQTTTIDSSAFSFIGDFFEYILKRLQLWKINKGKTTEIITDTQLWFFPDDFEKKVNL